MFSYNNNSTCNDNNNKLSMYSIVGLTSHLIHYRSFWGRFYGSDSPTNSVKARAVRIELFTARVLYRVAYRVLEYSMDTGSSY